MKSGKMLVLILFGLMLTGAANAAVIPLTDGVWQMFSWDGLGPIYDNLDGYQITVPVGWAGRLRVVDCCRLGDEFSVWQTPGGLAFNTSPFGGTDGGISTGHDPDSAWLDAGLSKGSKVFGNGDWQIDIEVTRLAAGFTSGGGWVRLDLSEVLEPATMALFGSGLLALGLVRRFRRS